MSGVHTKTNTHKHTFFSVVFGCGFCSLSFCLSSIQCFRSPLPRRYICLYKYTHIGVRRYICLQFTFIDVRRFKYSHKYTHWCEKAHIYTPKCTRPAVTAPRSHPLWTYTQVRPYTLAHTHTHQPIAVFHNKAHDVYVDVFFQENGIVLH